MGWLYIVISQLLLLEYIGTLEAVSGTQDFFGNLIIFALRYKNGDAPTQMSTIERPILNQRTSNFGIGELHLAYHTMFNVQEPSIINKILTKIKKKNETYHNSGTGIRGRIGKQLPDGLKETRIYR